MGPTRFTAAATATRRWTAGRHASAAWAAGGEPEDAQRISATHARARASREVFCYFDNDQKVRAPFDARRLTERLMPEETLSLEPLDRQSDMFDS
jgi:uncharacterized protein YecE (DUF72 family)